MKIRKKKPMAQTQGALDESTPLKGSRIPQHEVVTLALYLLGGDRGVVDTEDVAMKASSIAPGRFTWRKYPEQVNLELVRVFLSDAKKAEFGSLVSGSGTKGWTLTVAGLVWARDRSGDLLNADMRRARQEKRSSAFSEVRWRTERARIQATTAWQRWLGHDLNLTTREVEQVFRIDSYSSDQVQDLKINRLLSLFNDDEEIRSFLMKLATTLRPGEDPT